MDLLVKKNITINNEQKNITIDFSPYLAFAFATNSKVKSDIDILFNKNRQRAHQLAKKSKYYYSNYLLDGDIKRDIQMRK